MKTIYIAHLGLIFLCFVLYKNASAQTKTAFLGQIVNGQPVITDIARSTEVLRGSLPATALPSDIRIFYEENEHAYYLTAKVTNDPIQFIAIRMVTDNSLLCVRSGPGYEILCLGDKCMNCISKTPKGNDVCKCTDSNSSEVCSSVAVLTINF